MSRWDAASDLDYYYGGVTWRDRPSRAAADEPVRCKTEGCENWTERTWPYCPRCMRAQTEHAMRTSQWRVS